MTESKETKKAREYYDQVRTAVDATNQILGEIPVVSDELEKFIEEGHDLVGPDFGPSEALKAAVEASVNLNHVDGSQFSYTASPSIADQAIHIYRSYTEKSFRRNELETLISDHGRYYLISVRGTEVSENFSIQDVLRDMFLIPLPGRKSKYLAHGGMRLGADVLCHDAHIQALPKTKPIYIGGHSLGAGVSVLMVRTLQKMGFTVARWVGFGCPNVYRFKVPKFENVQMCNYRYGKDIVSYVPAKLLFSKPPSKVIKIGRASKSWPNIADHAVEKYVSWF